MLPINTVVLMLAMPFIAIIVFILYLLVVKPKVTLPLSNEQDEGWWRIPLPQLGKMNEGRVTTARRYVEGLWAKLLDNTSDGVDPLVKLRTKMLQSHLYAQRIGRDKIIYLFDENPLEAQYHMREDMHQRFGSDIATRFIHSIKDCTSIGKRDGFEFIGVKLNPEEFKFTDDERKDRTILLQALSYLKLAATNVEAVKEHKDRADSYKELFDSQLKDTAEERSEKERAKRALGQRPLTEPGEAVIKKTVWGKISNKFFSWPQVAIALGAYLITPNVMQYANVSYPEPSTVALALAIIAFFVAPFILGVLKR